MSVAQVIHIITGLDVGGAERSLYTLLTNGLEGPFRNHVVSLTGPGHYGPKLVDDGIPLTCLHMRPGRPSLRALRRLQDCLELQRPHIIHGWMYHGNLAATAGQALYSRRAPLVWSIRLSLEDLPLLGRRTRFVISLGALCSSRPSSIVYNSQRSRVQHAGMGYSGENSIFIPNGFDTNRWRPDFFLRSAVRSELGISEDDRVIGFVGRSHAQKDLPNLFKAFNEVAARDPRVVLVAAGHDLKRFAPPAGRVIFTEQHDDVPSLMRAFDVFCLASRLEGFPNVIGEAMATGVPCVTTDVGDAAAIVGDTGWVVPARDSDALAQALIAAIKSPPERLRALGVEARHRIEANYSLASTIRNYVTLYERLLKEQRQCVE